MPKYPIYTYSSYVLWLIKYKISIYVAFCSLHFYPHRLESINRSHKSLCGK